LILGAGYAGVSAARRLAQLADRTWSITLVDHQPAQTLQVRLADVVSGTIPAALASVPHRELVPRRVRVLLEDITSIDLSRRRIDGCGRTVEADRILVCLGTTAADEGVPGVQEHAFRLTTSAEAGALHDRLRTAPIDAPPRAVIVGAGYTATEVAAAIVSARPGTRVLITSDARTLLGLGRERLGRIAERSLRRQGVAFRLGESVSRVEHGRLVMADGTLERADLVVWATPSEPGALVRDAFALPPGARVPVDLHLRVRGHADVFAAGDVAAVRDARTGALAPSNAQVAIYSGTLAAENIVAEASDGRLRECRPRATVEVIALGPNDAVADGFGITVRGAAARAVKNAALARYLYRAGGARLAAHFLRP
jgi:NADH dehydrogenase